VPPAPNHDQRGDAAPVGPPAREADLARIAMMGKSGSSGGGRELSMSPEVFPSVTRELAPSVSDEVSGSVPPRADDQAWWWSALAVLFLGGVAFVTIEDDVKRVVATGGRADGGVQADFRADC
jgi:hypothetical protein